MNEILISFVLITNLTFGMSTADAKKASIVSVQKLNTLKPFKFKASRIIKMRDPFPFELDGYKRLAMINSRIQRINRIRGNYVTVIDRSDIAGLLGIAYMCQPRELRKQASLVFHPRDVNNKADAKFTGIIAAHETGHQIGFPHVNIFDKFFISIMSFDISAYRYISTQLKRFVFYDKPDALAEFNCSQNSPKSLRKVIEEFK